MPPFLRTVLRACQIIFALFLVYFAIRLIIYHFALVTFPFPNTFREGAMMTSTDALVKGLNPYAMELQPQHANQYGIVYPLLVWPWAKAFGTTLFIHRMVTAFFIAACCILVFLVLRRMAVALLLNLWAVLILYSSLLFPGTSTPSVDPGATGTFFLLLTIFIPWFCEYSYMSLIGSILFGILAFYTKPYALLGIPIMSSYLFFFISKRKGIFYGFLSLVLLTISVIGINQLLPAYFDSCFFSSLNMAHAWSSIDRLYMQVGMYSDLHKWTFILMGVFIAGYAFKMIRDNSWDSLKKSRFPLVLYAGLCSSFILYISLGRHTGATLWYFFQLLSPFLLIGAAWLFNRYAFWPIVCVPFLVLNLHTMTLDQDYKYFDKKMPGWPELALLTTQYHHILNSAVIAPLLIEENKEVYDNGHTEYFLSGAQREGWMKGLFKEDGRVVAQQMLFFSNIRTKVENKEFDLIILQPSLLPLGVDEDVRKYYKFEGELMLYVPQDRRPYTVTVWRPL